LCCPVYALWLFAHKDKISKQKYLAFKYFGLDEGYSRNVSCSPNMTSTFISYNNHSIWQCHGAKLIRNIAGFSRLSFLIRYSLAFINNSQGHHPTITIVMLRRIKLVIIGHGDIIKHNKKSTSTTLNSILTVTISMRRKKTMTRLITMTIST
jgi:hypothetical protein